MTGPVLPQQSREVERMAVRVVDVLALLEQVRAPERPDARPSEFDHGYEQAVADVRAAVITLTGKE